MNTLLRTYWKAVLGVLLVFILGWLAGVICTAIVVKHKALTMLHAGPTGVAQMIEKRLTHSLSLDAAQQKQVSDALMDNVRQRQQLQGQIQPQLRELNEQTVQKIDAALTAEQQEKFHKNIEAFRERFGANAFSPGTVPADEK